MSEVGFFDLIGTELVRGRILECFALQCARMPIEKRSNVELLIIFRVEIYVALYVFTIVLFGPILFKPPATSLLLNLGLVHSCSDGSYFIQASKLCFQHHKRSIRCHFCLCIPRSRSAHIINHIFKVPMSNITFSRCVSLPADLKISVSPALLGAQ